MAKPTQSVQKRQRELKKHQRRQAKERRRAERQAEKESGSSGDTESSDIAQYFQDPEGPAKEPSPGADDRGR